MAQINRFRREEKFILNLKGEIKTMVEERKLEITEDEAKTALNWWEKPQADNLERSDKNFVKKLKVFISG